MAYIDFSILIRKLKENPFPYVTKNSLYRRGIAKLRDDGVVLASCNGEYQNPISVDDLNAYMNHSVPIVGSMVHRMGLCRKTMKNVSPDLFDSPSLIFFRRYFDEPS